MRKVAVIALVLLALVVGLPLAMGMTDMAPCPSCTGDAPIAIAMCLAIISLFVLVFSTRSTRLAASRQAARLLLFADPPERPPRIA